MRRNFKTPQPGFHANTWQSGSRALTLRSLIENVQRGERLRQLREARGLTIEDAAHEIGVSTKTLWNWETGHGIKRPNLKRVAGFYKVEIQWLEHGETPDLMESLDGQPDVQVQLNRMEARQKRVEAALQKLGRDLVTGLADLQETAESLRAEAAQRRSQPARRRRQKPS